LETPKRVPSDAKLTFTPLDAESSISIESNGDSLMAEPKITYCKIYPGIGVARVGDSPDGFFIGPEAPGRGPEPEGGFKDLDNRIKRQAARFRIYGFDATDTPVQEVTLDTPGASIAWSVQLANAKASWYAFDGVTKGLENDTHGTPDKLRNKGVQDRSQLEIRPGPKQIAGKSKAGDQFAFNDGAFVGKAVYLGELRTDESGRLIVLGGRGTSDGTPDAKPITHYANNDFWHDDTSDGPVTAKVTLDGVDVEVRGTSWVICGPPKFATHIANVVPLYDVMAEAAGAKPPTNPSFRKDIYPIFARIADQQWVNAMSLRGHGPQKAANFRDPAVIRKLRDKSDAGSDFRSAVFKRIRDPRLKSVDQASYMFMPSLSGDEGDVREGDTARWLYLTENLYSILERWSAGQFDDDWVDNEPSPPPFDKIEVAQQPAALNRAALEMCTGGAFFPGIEITYIARNPDYYSEPFRFKAGQFQPGEMTKRMAVPWQADFYECQVHWWPAQRPDDVINQDVVDLALEEFGGEARNLRLAASLTDRIRWDRGVGARLFYPDPPEGERAPQPGDNDMVSKWREMGFVTPFRTKYGELLHVESGRSRYDGLRDRDYFYYLLNIELYPDFLPRAKQIAESFLQAAEQLMENPATASDPDARDLRFFAYSRDAFDQRLDEIYAKLQRGIEQDPMLDPDYPFRNQADAIERIRQFAPLNQLDGAWIRNIAHAGPIDEVSALLFSVWMDEMGDGNPEQNHANVYTRLMEKVGIVMQPINSLDYANNKDLLDSAFTVPMFELAISQFTKTFYPEILGMTLQLEWEVLALWPTVMLFREVKLDPHFYELHIGIDNAANGHGAKARQAVYSFLDAAYSRGGSAEVQDCWRRIWRGYVAFASSGTLGRDLAALLKARKDNPETPEDKVIDIINEKKAYGSLNHGPRTLGTDLINDLFEDPPAFLKALVQSNYIVPGSPAESPFFRYISFDGPMYKVFNDDEIRAWQDWVVWLGGQSQPEPVEKDPAKLMAACIDALRGRQGGSTTHRVTKLTGPDPHNPGQTVSLSVSEWFTQPTPVFMSVLSDPANGWIVRKDSAHSPLLTQILSLDNPMSQAFQGVAPNSGGKTWKDVLIAWIDADCPVSKPTAQGALTAALAARRHAAGSVLRHRVAAIRRLGGRELGMGAIH
jgi:hypothetical protein